MDFSEHLVKIWVGIVACQTFSGHASSPWIIRLNDQVVLFDIVQTVPSVWGREKQSHTESLGISETLKGVAAMISHAVYIT